MGSITEQSSEESRISMAEGQQEALNPSELGTKEYWDNLYARELDNYSANREDEGTIWFDESNAEQVVRKQLNKLANRNLLHQKHSKFLDLGTGNGHMLFSLCEPEDDDDEDDENDATNRWKGQMVGVDYSLASIELAKRILDRSNLQHQLQFHHWDILSNSPCPVNVDFDVVLDKGTFDAISLMAHQSGSEHPCRVYRLRVEGLMRRDGFLIVTSCNWTKDELVDWLTAGDSKLRFWGDAEYPTFMFGGRKGQSVVTVVFRRSS